MIRVNMTGSIRPGLRDETGDRGSISLLLIGLCALILLIASVTIAITTVHIERAQLQSLADRTSSAVALSPEEVDLTGALPTGRMTDRYVVDKTAELLESSGAYTEFQSLTIDGATGSPDSLSAQVVLTSYVRLPLVSVVLPQGVQIRATGTARSVFVQ